MASFSLDFHGRYKTSFWREGMTQQDGLGIGQTILPDRPGLQLFSAAGRGLSTFSFRLPLKIQVSAKQGAIKKLRRGICMKGFPIDTLKANKSFVEDIATDSEMTLSPPPSLPWRTI